MKQTNNPITIAQNKEEEKYKYKIIIKHQTKDSILIIQKKERTTSDTIIIIPY